MVTRVLPPRSNRGLLNGRTTPPECRWWNRRAQVRRTSAATCAAWTALSNVYSDAGAFLYDLSLARCPDLLILS